MSINPSDQRLFAAASGTTVGAMFYQTATSTLPVPAISYSAGALVSPLQTVLSPEEIEEREWDELFASPESQADMKKTAAQIEANIASGKSIKYIPGKSLAELFRT